MPQLTAVVADASGPNGHAVRSELSTRRMLDAAGELIAEGGYAKMTLASIGERAGYSRGLATMRFGSKAKLLEALVDRIVNHWNHQVVGSRLRGRSGLDRVVALVEAIREQYAGDTRSLRVLYALMFEALGPNEELRARFVELHRQMRARLARMIRAGIEDGSISASCDPDREAELVVAMLRGVAFQWRLDPDAFDPVAALEHAIAAIAARLAPPHRASRRRAQPVSHGRA